MQDEVLPNIELQKIHLTKTSQRIDNIQADVEKIANNLPDMIQEIVDYFFESRIS
jgi:hypothetical protein